MTATGALPPVTVGLPVRNGERYLPRALSTLLTQDYGDFELIISDNASTDGTAELCAAAAADDPRVRYVRQPANIGAIPNFRYVLAQARGRYFRWAAADDEIGPGYLAGCVSALDSDPGVLLAHAGCVDIDERGKVLVHHPRLATDDPDPVRRLRALLGRHESLDIYGLTRTATLRSLRPFGTHPEADRVVIVGLVLRGRFAHAGDPLFRRRRHPEQSLAAVTRSAHRVAWLDPHRSGGVTLPAFELAADLLRAIYEAPLTGRQRRSCYAAMHLWVRDNWEKMGRNVARAVVELGRPAAG